MVELLPADMAVSRCREIGGEGEVGVWCGVVEMWCCVEEWARGVVVSSATIFQLIVLVLSLLFFMMGSLQFTHPPFKDSKKTGRVNGIYSNFILILVFTIGQSIGQASVPRHISRPAQS